MLGKFFHALMSDNQSGALANQLVTSGQPEIVTAHVQFNRMMHAAQSLNFKGMSMFLQAADARTWLVSQLWLVYETAYNTIE